MIASISFLNRGSRRLNLGLQILDGETERQGTTQRSIGLGTTAVEHRLSDLQPARFLAKDEGSLLGRCLKYEIQRPRFTPGDGDFLPLRPVGFVPGRNRIFAWGKLRQSELSIWSSNSEV